MSLPGTIARVTARFWLGFWPPPDDGMQSLRRMRFLFDCVVRFAKPQGVALEIGCYKAGSTVYLAKACLRVGIGNVIAIDLFSGTPSWNQPFDTEKEARTRIAQYGLDSIVELVRGDSRQVPWDKPIAVLHVDGDHAYEAVRADLRRFLPHVLTRLWLRIRLSACLP
jgi:predicted O-methyltransferase YrrM